MSEPIEVDIPHKLGMAGARARLEAGVGKIAGMFPGGGVVQHRWDGDTMHFTVSAMGQTIASKLDVFESRVHATVDLPPMLALFANKIREKLQRDGPKLLE
jgi:hypothetical protein